MLSIIGITIAYWIFCTTLSSAQSFGQCLATYNYDLTNEDIVLESQDDFDAQSSTYFRNLRRCIIISTNTTDHVIKLEELYFLLESSVQCTLDYVTIYDSAGFISELGRYCGSDGPGTIYSSTNSMFIFFRSDSTLEYPGFRFMLSSIHKDDVPSEFSPTSIAALAICVVIIITIIAIFVVCVIKGAKKHSSRIHVMPEVDRDGPYVISPYSGRYTSNRMPRNYVLPKPPSYQESIRSNPGHTAQPQTGQPRTGPTSSGHQASASSSGARVSGGQQDMYSYQSVNTPDDVRYPMSPPPAYQP